MDHLKYLKQIGRRGGAVKSEAKTVAARANAKLPRPGAWKCGECGATRFATVKKTGGVRIQVRCRKCGLVRGVI